MSKKENKDHNVKVLSLSSGRMGDLLFVLKPLKEKQMEMMFWSGQLKEVQNDILKAQSIDQTKWSCDWQKAFQTGKLICTKLPEPKVVKEEVNKNGKSKDNK